MTVKEVAVNDVTNEVLDDCEEIKLSDDVKVSTSNQAKAKVDVWTEESKKIDEQKFVCIFSEIFTYSWVQICIITSIALIKCTFISIVLKI